MRYKAISGSYNGYEWKSLKDLSISLGRHPSYVSTRMKERGFSTVEEFLDWYINREVKRHNRYKGYSWVSMEDLSVQLGRSHSYVGAVMIKKKFDTVEQFLDWYLDKKAYLQSSGSYRGYTWHSCSDLSRQLGKSDTYVINAMRKKGFSTVYEVIDWYLDNKRGEFIGSYRGYEWVSLRDLAHQLGKSDSSYISYMMKTKHFNNIEQFLDWYLDKKDIPNIYRGYTWDSHIDLSHKLGMSPNYVGIMMSRKKFTTVEQFLDWYIESHDESNNARRITRYAGEYRGYKWQSYVDLSIQLGMQETYVSSLIAKGKFNSVEDILDWYIDNRIDTSGSYKGFEWKSMRDLSIQLDRSGAYASNVIRRKNFSAEEFIDWYIAKYL